MSSSSAVDNSVSPLFGPPALSIVEVADRERVGQTGLTAWTRKTVRVLPTGRSRRTSKPS
jgi:hypothetical protein